MNDDGFRSLLNVLMRNPVATDVMSMAAQGASCRYQARQGQAGGLRVIYYWWEAGRQFWLFTLYDKGEFGIKTSAKENNMINTTEQEVFWEGNFGNEYTDRNKGSGWVAANAAFFSRVLTRTQKVQGVLELGSNIGLNLMVLRYLLPTAKLSAVEINEKAASELRTNLPDVDLHVNSILKFQPNATWDLVFTKGVLIHINPDKLPIVYELMYRASSRYLLVSEYYNPKPTEISYRGHTGKLFKRDFAGEILDKFSDLSLIDYGFVYHRDPSFPQDDITWFLMKKQ